MNHADDGVIRTGGDLFGGGHVGIFQRGQQLLHFLRIALLAFAPPPEGAFADDGDGDEGANEYRPHDRAAFQEELENNVCEHNFDLVSVQLQFVSDAGLEKPGAGVGRQPPMAFDEIHRSAVEDGKTG